MGMVTIRKTPARTDPAAILKLRKPLTVESVRQGLPVIVVQRLTDRLALTNAQMMLVLKLPRQTYIRRREAGRLTADESDRVARYAELLARATDLIGDEDEAALWLSQPAPALDGETPIDHATTEIGATNVRKLIGRLEHGIPS